MDNETKLRKAKERLDALSREKNQLSGRKQALEDQLREYRTKLQHDHGVSTVKELDVLIADKKAKVDQLLADLTPLLED